MGVNEFIREVNKGPPIKRITISSRLENQILRLAGTRRRLVSIHGVPVEVHYRDIPEYLIERE